MPSRGIFICRARLHRLMRIALVQQPLPVTSLRFDDVEVVLLRSEQHAPDEAWDLCWAEHCARLRVVPIAGTHHSMFEGSNRQALADRIREAVGI